MTTPDVTPARILIVDDEAALMQALCDTLRDHGYEATGFTSGLAALVLLQKTSFDLLLADLSMPEMDGISLLAAALEVDPNLVGIIMTGQGTIATAVEAMKTGAFDYILKPFKVSVILPVLSRALAMRRLRLENDALERRVRERTSELQAANEELDAFSYSVSHDLRAPLRRVVGFSQILVKDFSLQMPTEAVGFLDRIISSTQRMEQLIEDLLALSHLGRRALAKRPVNMAALVLEAIGDLRKQNPDRDIEIAVGAIPACSGDESLLKQVIVNLLSNAFKFTRNTDRPLVDIGYCLHGEEGVYYVSDNGAGFDMQYAEKLFGVFQRFHRDTEFEGTGVGLSIVQRIVKRHGGRIWAEAEVGKGATFHFTIP